MSALKTLALSVVKSPTVRKTFLTLLAAVLAALGYGQMGCAGGRLEPKAQRAVDTFACTVDAVQPYVGSVLDAEELVRDAIQGKADLVRVLTALGATRADLVALHAALGACFPAEGVVEAPGPAETLRAALEAPDAG